MNYGIGRGGCMSRRGSGGALGVSQKYTTTNTTMLITRIIKQFRVGVFIV